MASFLTGYLLGDMAGDTRVQAEQRRLFALSNRAAARYDALLAEASAQVEEFDARIRNWHYHYMLRLEDIARLEQRVAELQDENAALNRDLAAAEREVRSVQAEGAEVEQKFQALARRQKRDDALRPPPF